MAERVVFPTAWNDQGTRKTSFGAIFISLANRRGYSLGNSLKVPGSYAYEFQSRGRGHKIGLKTSSDRFLNTAFVMGSKVDEVWIMAFKWNVEEPDDVDWRPVALQVYKIASKDLAALFDKVHAARAKHTQGKGAPYAFIPIDADNLSNPKLAPYEKVVGSLDQHMKLIFEAPLVFDDRGSPRVEDDEPASPTPRGRIVAVDEPSKGLAELVFTHKEALAKLYATTPDKIKILIEA